MKPSERMVATATLRALVIAVGLGSISCTPLVYEPERPPRVAAQTPAGSASAEVQRVVIDPRGVERYQIRLDAPAGSKLGPAFISGPYQPECSSLVTASLMRIDGRVRLDWKPIPIGGSHDLGLEFPNVDAHHGGPPARGPIAVDFVLVLADEPTCMRVVLSGERGENFQSQNQRVVGFGFDAVTPLRPVAGVDAILALPLELGRWFGPLRLAAEPGLIGVASCNPSTCSRNASGKTLAGPALPFGASALYYPPAAQRLGLAAGVRLREYVAWLPADTGSKSLWVHAPELVLNAGLVAPPLHGGLPGGARVFALDLQLTGGLFMVRESDATTKQFALGGGLLVRSWL